MLIATLTYNRLEMTRRMFAALYEFYDLDEKSRHIVVDNGSSDGTLSWARRCQQVDEVIPLGKNLGAAMGHNVIAAAALESGDDLVLVIENDWLCLSPCLRDSVELMRQYPDVERVAFWQAQVPHVRKVVRRSRLRGRVYPHWQHPVVPSFPVSLVRGSFLAGHFPVSHEKKLAERGPVLSILPQDGFFAHGTGPLSWGNRAASYGGKGGWVW